MALSRSMKNLMHESAQARRGLSKPQPAGGGRSSMVSQAMDRYKQQRGGAKPTPGPNRGPRGPVKPTPGGGRWGTPAGPGGPVLSELPGRGGRNPTTGGPGGPVLRPSPGRTPMTGGPRGPAGQQALMKAKMTQAQQRGGGGGVMGRPAVQPRPSGGTFGFAARGGGGTPALQQATAGARMQAMQQRAAPRPAGLPGAISGAQQQAAMQRARAPGPAALTQPRGQSVASRIGGTQGPPARRGGMARALGSGGSRRRMLR